MRLMTLTFPTRWTAVAVAASLLMPALAGCGNSGGSTATPSGGGMAPAPQMAPASAPQKVGLSGKQKVVLLAGAALLFYLYKKDQSNNNAAAAAGAAKPQLYQSKNGGIYYRDANHKAVWVTAPSQGVAVPAAQVQQYLPNYQQYQGQPTPAAPPGYATQSATQYDPSLAAPGGPSGPGG